MIRMGPLSSLIFILLLQRTASSISSLLGEVANNIISDPIKAGDVLDEVVNIFSSPRQKNDRNDLTCSGCDDTTETYEKCCACKWKPIWQGKELNLPIEYLSVLGKTIVVPEGKVRNGTWYKIECRDAEIGAVPSNLCNWDTDPFVTERYGTYLQDLKPYLKKIVKIDFTGNKIRKIVDLNCLTDLDTLDLGHNAITHLPNDSFNELTHLRVLNLEHNFIKAMEAVTLSNPNLHLTHVYLQDNKLQEIDVTNCLSLYPFCTIDYSHNQVGTVTNVNNFRLDPSFHYGPGYVSFRGNNIRSFPDFRDLLHLDSIQQLGVLLEFGFDFRDVPLTCDGMIAPYLEVAQQIDNPFWRNYMDVSCDSPPNLKGRMIKDIKVDELVTDYICYQECQCQDRPSQNYVDIDCHGRDITNMSIASLPNPPYCDNIHLNMSGNNIQIIEDIPNFNRVTHFDISNNDVVEITLQAAAQLENLTQLDISNNKNLNLLPEQFRYLNVCKMAFNGNIFDCNCESTWMSDWWTKNSCQGNNSTLTCRVPGHGLIPANDFHKELLECVAQSDTYDELAGILTALLLVIILIATVTYYLRYEILVILLRLRRIKKNHVIPLFTYDVYLSFDENDTYLRKWVNTELVPELEARGYTVFLPYRDFDFGSIRDNMTIEVLRKTRNFMVLLTDSYFDQEVPNWTNREWKHGWHMSKANKLQNILLLNFDHISSFDVDQPSIRAFVRVGGQIEFTNQNRDIIDQISTKLGPPSIRAMSRVDVNKKPILDLANIFYVYSEEI